MHMKQMDNAVWFAEIYEPTKHCSIEHDQNSQKERLIKFFNCYEIFSIKFWSEHSYRQHNFRIFTTIHDIMSNPCNTPSLYRIRFNRFIQVWIGKCSQMKKIRPVWKNQKSHLIRSIPYPIRLRNNGLDTVKTRKSANSQLLCRCRSCLSVPLF